MGIDMTHQTPCEKLGYKVGDEFVVVEDVGHAGIYVDRTVTLVSDDGSTSPLFESDGYDRIKCFYLDGLKPLGKPTKNTLQAFIEAAKSKDEALQRLESELLELGYKLVAVDAKPEPAEDMSDWRNWREGDLVECVVKTAQWFTMGRRYEVGTDKYGDFGVMDSDGDVVRESEFSSAHCRPDFFKFHSRPKVSV